jgi:PAS domain S-box-containing protein
MSSDFLDTVPAPLDPPRGLPPSCHDVPYQQIFEAAGVGMALIDSQGHYLEVNQRYADIAHRERHTLIGTPCMALVHAEDLPVKRALMDATLKGHQTHFTMDMRYLSPQGDVIWAQTNTVLIRDGQGMPLHFVSVAEDISERKRYQEALLSAQAAERASKAKTEFLSRMSHELRTPLNAMLGFAQLLRVDSQHPLHAAQRQKVDYIEQAGAHLLAMLTDVLDLSRIEAGRLPLSPESLGLKEVLQEALTLVELQAASRGVQVHVADIDPRWQVHADRVRLRQVLVNLLTNAIKYNRPQGEVWIDADMASPYVTLSVRDTGPGMSPDQQAHLFEPFNRLGAERSNVEGTGIGLVIVKRLVALMHGRIDVQSAVGQGTLFRVSLPGGMMAERAPGMPPPPGLDPQDGSGEPRFRLLYAEDNPVNIELLRHVMKMRPHWQLHVATCGAEAIDMALAEPPDVLLLDMHLGDMSGLDVSDALMSHHILATVPRVALSADVMPDQVKAAKDRQFLDYLTKPLEISQLFRVLDAQERLLVTRASH